MRKLFFGDFIKAYRLSNHSKVCACVIFLCNWRDNLIHLLAQINQHGQGKLSPFISFITLNIQDPLLNTSMDSKLHMKLDFFYQTRLDINSLINVITKGCLIGDLQWLHQTLLYNKSHKRYYKIAPCTRTKYLTGKFHSQSTKIKVKKK